MIRTPIIFGATEHVHIVSPDFLTLPKLNIAVPAATRIQDGYFVDAQGALLTLLAVKIAPYLVTEDTHDEALPGTPAKPGGVMTGYFGNMLIHTKIFDDGGSAFVAGDNISLAAGIIVHVDATNTIPVGEVIEVGDTYISVTLDI